MKLKLDNIIRSELNVIRMHEKNVYDPLVEKIFRPVSDKCFRINEDLQIDVFGLGIYGAGVY